MIKNEHYTLANGIKIPKVGYGTWQITDKSICIQGVLWALENGYRHIDTAAAYGNESFIAEAIMQSGISRQELFITSKLPAEKKGYEIAKEEFYATLARLQTDYLDLYLIHAPKPWRNAGDIDYTPDNIASWRAMIDLYNEGKIKAIGVSNFSQKDIEALIEATGFTPHVNQIKVHIGHNNLETKTYCDQKEILVEAYCPLASGRIFQQTDLEKTAAKYGVSVAQLSIRWCLQFGTLPLPKSTHEQRIIENLNLDFTIKKEDMDILSKW
jgi:diketogulonate reductase-like aldo/keto reductase